MKLRIISSYILLATFMFSCKSIKEEKKTEINGYIISLRKKNKKSIDESIDYWYIENMKNKENNKNTSDINLNVYYMLLKDFYDIKLCSQDEKFKMNNNKYESLINSNLDSSKALNFEIFENKPNLKINVNSVSTIEVYKVDMKHCICSKEYTLFPNYSSLEKFSYPIEIAFLKFEKNEKQFFQENKEYIVSLLK